MEIDDFGASGEFNFRGVKHNVTIKTIKGGSCLTIEVEDLDSADFWKGVFETSCKFHLSLLQPNIPFNAPYLDGYTL